MNSYLADVNVWVALLVKEHVHHAATLDWYRSVDDGQAGLCRHAQLGTVRLLSNAYATRGNPVPAVQAWAIFQEWCEDGRVAFLSEPPGIDEVLPTLFRYRVPTPGLVNDAYLAAFAIASARTLLTRDRGFLEFRGLDVEILG